MFKNKLVLAALLTAVLSVSAHGQTSAKANIFKTGNGLLEALHECDKLNAGTATGVEAFHCGLAEGFIVGVAQAADASKFIDVPEGVTAGQMFDVVAKYLEEHPETRQQSALILTGVAVGEAWPAKPASGK